MNQKAPWRLTSCQFISSFASVLWQCPPPPPHVVPVLLCVVEVGSPSSRIITAFLKNPAFSSLSSQFKISETWPHPSPIVSGFKGRVIQPWRHLAIQRNWNKHNYVCGAHKSSSPNQNKACLLSKTQLLNKQPIWLFPKMSSDSRSCKVTFQSLF